MKSGAKDTFGREIGQNKVAYRRAEAAGHMKAGAFGWAVNEIT